MVKNQTLNTHTLELSWTDRGSISSPNVRRKSRNTNVRLILTEEMHENCVKLLNLSKKNFTALKLKNFNDEINNFFMKLIITLNEMEKLRKFLCSTFDIVARRRLVEDQDTILELTGKILDLQNEIDCMNGSEDFQDAESLRSGNSHVTSRRTSFAPPLHQRNSSIEEPLHLSTVEKANTKSRSEMPFFTVIQRVSHLQWRRLFKELWSRPTTADFRSSFRQIPYTSCVRLLEDKIQDREATHWIKEVEMVDSVDD